MYRDWAPAIVDAHEPDEVLLPPPVPPPPKPKPKPQPREEVSADMCVTRMRGYKVARMRA